MLQTLDIMSDQSAEALLRMNESVQQCWRSMRQSFAVQDHDRNGTISLPVFRKVRMCLTHTHTHTHTLTLINTAMNLRITHDFLREMFVKSFQKFQFLYLLNVVFICICCVQSKLFKGRLEGSFGGE